VHDLRREDAPGRQLLRVRELREHERLQLKSGHLSDDIRQRQMS
jgi:hypothetical protein